MNLRQLTVLALVAGVVVAAALFLRPQKPESIAVGTRADATGMIGRHLAEHHPGARILVISNPFTLEKGRDPAIYEYEKAGIRGLRLGIGDRLEIGAVDFPELDAGYLRSPQTFPINPFSTTPLSYVVAENAFDDLAARHEDCSVIVSLIGLPVSIRDSEIWKSEEPRVFALLLPDLTMLGSTSDVAEAFASGRIACALVRDPEGGKGEADRFILVTRDTVGETIAAHPEVFGFPSVGK